MSKKVYPDRILGRSGPDQFFFGKTEYMALRLPMSLKHWYEDEGDVLFSKMSHAWWSSQAAYIYSIFYYDFFSTNLWCSMEESYNLFLPPEELPIEKNCVKFSLPIGIKKLFDSLPPGPEAARGGYTAAQLHAYDKWCGRKIKNNSLNNRNMSVHARRALVIYKRILENDLSGLYESQPYSLPLTKLNLIMMDRDKILCYVNEGRGIDLSKPAKINPPRPSAFDQYGQPSGEYTEYELYRDL